MAEVTYGSPAPVRHVFGDCVVKFYVASGASGSIINTGMKNVLYVANQPFTKEGTASLITGISESNGVVTITSSGPMVNEVVMVIARVG